MLFVTQTALELGFQYALVAMALFLSYRVLDIADLTTDGCFILGCAVSVSLTASGYPFLAIPAAMAAGAIAMESSETINPSMSAALLRRRAGFPRPGGAETGGSAT